MKRQKYQRSNYRQIILKGDIALVPLTMGKYAIIDASDVWKVQGWNWQTHVSNSGKIYARRGVTKNGLTTRVYMHNIILPVRKGYVPHHKDGDGLNNRLGNLEPQTSRNNILLAQVNRPKPQPTLGHVSFNKYTGKWVARLYVGSFESRHEAKLAISDEAAKRKKAPAPI